GAGPVGDAGVERHADDRDPGVVDLVQPGQPGEGGRAGEPGHAAGVGGADRCGHRCHRLSVGARPRWAGGGAWGWVGGRGGSGGGRPRGGEVAAWAVVRVAAVVAMTVAAPASIEASAPVRLPRFHTRPPRMATSRPPTRML